MSIPLSAFQSIQVNSLSGYTLATPFEYSLVKEVQYTEAAITADYKVVWWFGDGQYSRDYAPSHVYEWPGVYEVKMQLFNNSLSALRTVSTTVTAHNFISDEVTWNYTNWPSISTGLPFHGYQSCKTGTASGPVPITVDYSTSITDPNLLNFTFYAYNSRSQPWNEVVNSQLANLRPRWRFTTASAGDFEQDNVLANTVLLTGTEVKILSSGDVSSSGTTVGLSGTFDFYYIDDMPSMVVDAANDTVTANATTIWVTLNTKGVPNYQDFEYSSVPSYSNSYVSASSYFYVQTLSADHINITVNGKVPFYSTVWPYVNNQMVVSVNSQTLSGDVSYLSDKILYNYPLSATTSLSVHLVSSTSQTSILSAIFSNDASVETNNEITFDLANVNNIGQDIGGYYKASFTPYTEGTAVLAASGANITVFYDLSASGGDYNPYTITLATSSYTTIDLNGTSDTFNVSNFNSTYFIRKFGANFDYGATLKEYALQPTISENTVFFDDYLSSIAGVSATYEDTFGGVVFEKIANFVENTSDPATTNVDQFYSLSEQLGLTLDNYNYNIPPTLSRVFDLCSTQQSTVWGARSKAARNFAPKDGHPNLGLSLTAYDINTTTVTAGQKIVARDLFKTDFYELLEVPAINSYASITARNLESYFEGYSTATYPLTSYPLSGFYGWGLQTPVSSFYRFFVYDDTVNGQQKEGLVNWEDPYTALSELSGADHAEWVKDEGILENIFNYYIHKGLGLIKD